MNTHSNSEAYAYANGGLITRKRTKALPYRFYLVSVLGLCLAGIGLCTYLAISHYRIYTDLDYQSFCAITRSINCDTVSLSSYSVLAGAPVSIWGIFGYGFFIALVLLSSLHAEPGRRLWTLSQAVALAFSLVGIAFAAVSSLMIKSYCIVCIATYAVNFALLFVTWIIRRRFRAGSFFPELAGDIRFLWAKRAAAAPLLAALAVGLTATGIAFPAYWKIRPAESGRANFSPPRGGWSAMDGCITTQWSKSWSSRIINASSAGRCITTCEIWSPAIQPDPLDPS